MKFVVTTCLLFFSTLLSYSQQNFWSASSPEEMELEGQQLIYPEKFSSFFLDYQGLKSEAFEAPLDDQKMNILNSNVQVFIPMPDGSYELFHLVESPVYENELIQNFPGIKTFLAYNPNHPTWYARFDITPSGFHGMILGTQNGSVFIDPIMHLGDINHYFSYYKKNLPNNFEEFVCHLDDKAPLAVSPVNNSSGTHKSFGSCELRTYRLALTATGEYTDFHGGTVAQALAAQVTTMNRVNGVFERDMAIHMNIIGNNNLIIYTNGATDPFSNGNTGAMINENQTNTDLVIGAANYDIGHIFGTNSGGLAQLNSPCSNNKARGVTGSGAPIGDPFDIDYVAHEMGHQFGANHTQNNSCNRNNATAVEPGSASTIMGYAGICNPNVQNNSDDYFHGISMEEMGNFITGGSHTCPVKTPLPNIAPSVSLPSSSISIPANTPFSLTAFATDPNTANTLSYCWEQMDNTPATMPPVSTNTAGPSFRSFDPSTNPTRYFPNLPDVIAGVSPTWEVLSSVSRSMEFRVVVRDNATGGGCNDHQDITVDVIGTAGPFIVNNPSNPGITWTGNTNETITWDVANTDLTPISCSNVNILLSYDGGLTFLDTLASNVPNDGSESIIVPNIGSSNALVIVQCANGTFYDVSNNVFTIVAITNDFTFSASNLSSTVCLGNNAVYNLSVGLVGVFNNNVTLSATGLPAGLNITFSANTQAPSYNSILTISNTGAITPGTYNFDLEAFAPASGTKTLNASLTILPNLSGTISATNPTNGAASISSPLGLTWSAIPNASYNIVLASDAGLQSVLETASALSNETYTTGALPPNTTVYWQIEAYNTCDTVVSTIFSFTTTNCLTYTSVDVPVNISSSGTPTITSDLVINGAVGTINDLNVVDLTGNHTYIRDLVFTLTSPNGTSVILLDRICNNQNNFNINFDDAAPNNNYPCPPTDGGTYIPENALAAFNGEDANGTWVLTIDDEANQDGGNLNSWGIEVCFNPPACTTSVFNTNINACDSIFLNNTWFTNSTTLADTIQGGASSGCDSITNTSLTIYNSVNTSSSLTACDSAQVNGSWYFTSQAIVTSDTTVHGCDSTHTTNLQINNAVSTSSSVVACDSAQLNGTWYFSSQTLVNSFTANNSCDSIHTTVLTINNSSAPTNINLSTCDPNQVGSSSLTLSNAAGCDSVVITNTTLLPAATSTLAITNCDSALIGSTWYFNSTVFNDTISGGASNTCDSIVTYVLTIHNSVNTSSSFTACDSAQVNGSWYYTSQAIITSDTTVNGCDSTHTTNLQINNAVSTSSSVVACDSAQLNGTWYFSSQTLVNSFTANNSCDSTHTTVLTINNSSAPTNINLSTCDPNQVGSSSLTLSNAAGCDSVVITNTTLLPEATSTLAITNCDSAQIGSTWYFNSTVLNDTISGGASNACDSIVTYVLTIHNSVNTSSSFTACDSAQVNGSWYYTSQAIVTSDTTVNGCDSTHTTNLQINNAVSTSSSVVACDSAQLNGTWYFSSQTLVNSFTANNSCDSTHTTVLTINNSSAPTNINLSTCDPNQVGSSSLTLTNAAGCDSVVITNTTLLPAATSTLAITNCDSALIGSTWYFNSTVFNDTISGGASNTCDSIVTYVLTIHNSVNTSSSLTACDSAQVNGSWYYTSQAIVTSDTTVNGCDSIHTSNVTILNSSTTIDTIASCGPYTWIDGLTYTLSTDTASVLLSNSEGCDSLVRLDLSVYAIPVVNITLASGTLTATPGLPNYQWYQDSVLITGATNQNYTPTASGTYTCYTNNGFCGTFSNEIEVSLTGIHDAIFEFAAIYPNPISDIMHIDVGSENLESIRLIDIRGKIIAILDQTQRDFYMNDYAKGVYFVELKNNDKRSMLRIILK